MSFKDYIQHGWALCAIPPGSKGPIGEAAKGWQKREKAITNPDYKFMGAGLCHAWSGTCALDVDNFEVAEAYLAEKGIDLRELLSASDAVQISSGRPGRYKLLYLLPEPLPSKQLAPYKAVSTKTNKPETYHGFELRCGNKHGDTVQDVLPPTIHPDTGRPYEWVYGDDLCGDWRRLPAIPSDLLALWRDEISSAPQSVGPVAASGASSRELEEFLAGRDPDAPYGANMEDGSWLQTAAALHHETGGSAAGFDLFDKWSSRGSKYKGRADTAAKWSSFRKDAPNPITIGSLRQQHVADVSAFPMVEPTATPAASEGSSQPQSAEAGWEQVRALLEPRLVFVTGHDCYFDMASRGETWLSDRSVRHVFCPQMPTITTEGKDGKPGKTGKPDPVSYLQNSRSKKIVDAVGLHPGAPRLYKEDGREFVNRYWPQKIEPLRPKPFEEEAFMFLWSRMKDPVFQRWLMKFYAHALQKPGVKIQTAPLLYSAETGTGKNTICHVVPQLLFGERWVRTMSGNVLQSNFTDTLGETWWLYLEELRAGSTKADRVATTNKLKAWVTDSSIEVHPKGLKPYNIRNRLQITATSNFDDAIHLDNNDRRWAVCEMGDPLTEEEARNVYHFLYSERGPAVLNWIFRNTDLTGFNPSARAPLTMAKVTMIRASIGAWESTLVEHMVAGLSPFHRDIFTIQDAYEALAGRGGPQSHMALRNVLTKPPFGCVQLPNSRTKRLYAWRNIDQWIAQAETARLRYVETGHRPVDVTTWSDEVPKLIREMSADGDPQKPLCDLV
jgi:hypothetical protein